MRAFVSSFFCVFLCVWATRDVLWERDFPLLSLSLAAPACRHHRAAVPPPLPCSHRRPTILTCVSGPPILTPAGPASGMDAELYRGLVRDGASRDVLGCLFHYLRRFQCIIRSAEELLDLIGSPRSRRFLDALIGRGRITADDVGFLRQLLQQRLGKEIVYR